MAILRIRDPRVNITYVYESHSYWDSERKTSRAKRKLIGKIDEETGLIVPTSGRRRKKAQTDTGIESGVDSQATESEKDISSTASNQAAITKIEQLENMVSALQQSNHDLLTRMEQAASLIDSASSILKV